jgi:phosphate transport system permease protein
MKRLWTSGDSLIWLTGGALAFSLLMVGGLMGLVLLNGLGFFWPHDLVRLRLKDGRVILGPIAAREAIPQPASASGSPPYRIQVKQGNRDLYGIDYVWIDEADIASRDEPAGAMVVERTEWGNFHGFLKALREGDQPVAEGAATRTALEDRFAEVERVRAEIRRIEQDEIGGINYAQEQIRLQLRRLELKGIAEGEEVRTLRQNMEALERRYAVQTDQAARLRERLTPVLVLEAPDGQEKTLPLADVMRVYFPNDMHPAEKGAFYAAKVWEFVSANPRESNTEGGVFPAIFGTVMMVLIMSVVVTPLGILAAFYLREYARQGVFVSAVRIAVNNLAGVPSIVFGVFGVGFFIYFVGGGIDRLFFPERLPTPTFGTGGILWASLTLALLTMPVVIVATEEGLASIPMGMREASLALGATKFETTWRVVLPAVMPSIMTGLILSMARAAGEVAPLMITGVVKLAPALPVDGFWPFVHLDRKFMHLGFHIYDVGFQSPNVDAARPMVYTTTLLLLCIVVLLNLTAITLRSRLRKKYSGATV